MTYHMPPSRSIVPPDEGWEERTYYVVDVAFSSCNPIHRKILYVGFLNDKNPLGGGYTCLMRADGDDYGLRDVYYLKAVCKIPEMRD